MSRDTTVLPFRQRDAIDDPPSELAREGARRMLAQVLIAEADSFVAMWKDLKLPDGRDRIVRHGHGPHRAIQTGVGPVEVRRAKVRDRGDVGAEEKIRFSSSILPKWARRTRSLDALLPVLYLRGVSTGDFQEALAALLGKDAPNLSPAVISRLTADWQTDYDAWQKRDLSARRYVYVWADGVYLQARMEEAAECMLVLIGATPEGKKELVGFQTGVRASGRLTGSTLTIIKSQSGILVSSGATAGFPRKSAVPIWLVINLHGAEELRQTRGSQQSLDREVMVSEDAPSRGAGVGCAHGELNFVLQTQAIEINFGKQSPHRIVIRRRQIVWRQVFLHGLDVSRNAFERRSGSLLPGYVRKEATEPWHCSDSVPVSSKLSARLLGASTHQTIDKDSAVHRSRACSCHPNNVAPARPWPSVHWASDGIDTIGAAAKPNATGNPSSENALRREITSDLIFSIMSASKS